MEVQQKRRGGPAKEGSDESLEAERLDTSVLNESRSLWLRERLCHIQNFLKEKN